MKRILMVLVALVLVSSVRAQQTDKFRRNGLNFNMFTPSLNHRFLLQEDPLAATERRERDSINMPGFGYSFGIQYERRLLPWLSIDAGVQVQNYSVQQMTGTYGQTFRRTEWFVNIPLNLRFFYFRNSGWEVYAYCGPVVKFNVENFVHVNMVSPGGVHYTGVYTEESVYEVNRVRVEFIAGNGFRYYMIPSLAIGAELFFGLDLMPRYRSIPVNELEFRLGLNTGFYGRF